VLVCLIDYIVEVEMAYAQQQQSPPQQQTQTGGGQGSPKQFNATSSGALIQKPKIPFLPGYNVEIPTVCVVYDVCRLCVAPDHLQCETDTFGRCAEFAVRVNE
jgi:hypothetical protein